MDPDWADVFPIENGDILLLMLVYQIKNQANVELSIPVP